MANNYPQGVDMAAAIAAGFVLDRREAVPQLIGRHEDFLFVTGLAGTARDIAALTHDGAHIYTMAGAMGGACMIGLGLALARPDKRVLVVTGDGELLMNVGALATIAVVNPPNLAIVCVDNAITARPGIRRVIRALGWTLKGSLLARGSRQPAPSPPKGSSQTAPACCGDQTAPRLSCCASSQPTRQPSSATWTRPPVATASAPRCSGKAERDRRKKAPDPNLARLTAVGLLRQSTIYRVH